jgi:hypothetical protein
MIELAILEHEWKNAEGGISRENTISEIVMIIFELTRRTGYVR